MIPVCCICGASSPSWHNKEWEDNGGLQDFCPYHAKILQQKHHDLIECSNILMNKRIQVDI